MIVNKDNFVDPPSATDQFIEGLTSDKITYNESSIGGLNSSPGNVIRGKRLKSEVDNIQFPEDLAAHAMVFHFKEFGAEKDKVRYDKPRIVQSISLPVPAQLVDSMNTQYNEGMELGALGGALSDMQSAGEFVAAGEDSIKEAFNQGKFVAAGDTASIKSSQGLVTLALTNMLRKKSDGIKVGLARFFGSVPNPHLTALFKGVGFKSHSFSWRLAPSNISESIILKNIIHTFKRRMLPLRTNQNLTLEMPDEVDIYIRGHDMNHGMYEFKTAVIKNVTINFAPDNIPSFFAGTGAPTHVDFKVDFLETTIHTRSDYPAINVPAGANKKPTEMELGSNKDVRKDVGQGSYATKQRHQGVMANSTEAAGGFGQKTGGQKVVNPFIGRNPNR